MVYQYSDMDVQLLIKHFYERLFLFWASFSFKDFFAKGIICSESWFQNSWKTCQEVYGKKFRPNILANLLEVEKLHISFIFLSVKFLMNLFCTFFKQFRNQHKIVLRSYWSTFYKFFKPSAHKTLKIENTSFLNVSPMVKEILKSTGSKQYTVKKRLTISRLQPGCHLN